MKKNIGTTDRILRLIGAMVLVIVILTKVVTGTLAIVLGVIAAMLLLTSLVRFCPAYVPLKLSTMKKEAGSK